MRGEYLLSERTLIKGVGCVQEGGREQVES